MIDLAKSAKQTKIHLLLSRPLAKAAATILMLLFGRVRSKGRNRIPKQGGLLILSNHLSDLDPVVIQISCPRPIHFMAKSELFEMRLLGRILQSLGAFPVKRGEPDRAPLKLSGQLLREREVVGVFPEGEISESGELEELKSGVALIVRLAPGVPVICCGLRNTQKVMPYGKFTPRRTSERVEVSWGEPRTFEDGASSQEIMGWATAQLKVLS